MNHTLTLTKPEKSQYFNKGIHLLLKWNNFVKKWSLEQTCLQLKKASNSHNSFCQFISKHFGEIKKCESNSERNSISFASAVSNLECKWWMKYMVWSFGCYRWTTYVIFNLKTWPWENITDMLFVDSAKYSHFGGLLTPSDGK